MTSYEDRIREAVERIGPMTAERHARLSAIYGQHLAEQARNAVRLRNKQTDTYRRSDEHPEK